MCPPTFVMFRLLGVTRPRWFPRDQITEYSKYRVFFIESVKVIGYKIFRISLFYVVFGLRTEVTMGHLISDHFKMLF